MRPLLQMKSKENVSIYKYEIDEYFTSDPDPTASFPICVWCGYVLAPTELVCTNCNRKVNVLDRPDFNTLSQKYGITPFEATGGDVDSEVVPGESLDDSEPIVPETADTSNTDSSLNLQNLVHWSQGNMNSQKNKGTFNDWRFTRSCQI